MTYDEAVTVTGLVINAFPGERDWNADQIAMYAKGIERLDAEVATKAVLHAQATMPRRPDVASLISLSRSIAAQLRVEASRQNTPPGPDPYTKKNTLPFWVKRWVCARYLYTKFGKERDLRRFPEQQDWADPATPLMPPDAWVEEAKRISEVDALRAVAP